MSPGWTLLCCFALLSSACGSRRPARSVLGGQDWVNRYDLVYPKISSQSQNVDRTAYPDELTVELTVEGQKLTMELQLNKLVFGKNFKHTVHEKSGIKEFTVCSVICICTCM
jgi:hypothetical protein